MHIVIQAFVISDTRYVSPIMSVSLERNRCTCTNNLVAGDLLVGFCWFICPVFFQLEKYMHNKTVGVPVWKDTGLLCHSAGCDITLKLIELDNIESAAKLHPLLPSFVFRVSHIR